MNHYYIKQRINPQTGTYYVPCGKLSKKAAKDYERPIYGTNIMHAFKTLEEYKAKIAELEANGEVLV